MSSVAADMVGLVGDDSFRIRVLVGDPDITLYCTTPTAAMRDVCTPLRQSYASLDTSDYPLAIAVGIESEDGTVPAYVRGVFISWRCIQFLGMEDVSVGWYLPLPAGTRFKIYVLNVRHMGLIRIGAHYLDEVSEDVLPDVRVEGEKVCGERGPGLDGRRYVTLPRTTADGVTLPDFLHPAPGNPHHGVDVRLHGLRGDIRSSDTDFHHETTPCGTVDVFVRTPEWMRERRMITTRGAPWRTPSMKNGNNVLPQKRERKGDSEGKRRGGVRGGRDSGRSGTVRDGDFSASQDA